MFSNFNNKIIRRIIFGKISKKIRKSLPSVQMMDQTLRIKV